MTPMMRCLLSRRTSRAVNRFGAVCRCRWMRSSDSRWRIPAPRRPRSFRRPPKLTRPAFDGESVQDLSFPPRTGTYDGSGRVSEAGRDDLHLRRAVLAGNARLHRRSGAREVPIASGPSASQPRGAQPGRHGVASSTCRPRSTRPHGRSCFRVCYQTPQPPIRTPERPRSGLPTGANNVASVGSS